MYKIIIHHTAGTYTANICDKEHYHYIIEGTGQIVKGNYSIHDNDNCKDGKYAAHTYLGNTKSIGIALACNHKFNLSNPKNSTMYPITILQYRSLIKLCQRLKREYNVQLSNIYTHYEFDKSKNIKQGKIDITYLPHRPDIKPDEVLKQIRYDIQNYKL